jgi:hypothetical protein
MQAGEGESEVARADAPREGQILAVAINPFLGMVQQCRCFFGCNQAV